MNAPAVDVVVPSVGRPSLAPLLDALATQSFPGRVIVVDDRPTPGPPIAAGRPGVEVLGAGGGAGPAHARNVGWRASSAEWVAFLDDDVVVEPGWVADLARDLAGSAPAVAGIQGRVHVPRPEGRRPTDWERDVAGLERGRWITADLAVRRAALAAAGGFDERFPRAYREDADLALRLADRGYRLARGRRRVRHPVPAAPWIVSVIRQRGNADDALMRRLHGAGWRARADAPGAFRRHVAVTAAAGAAVAAGLAGRRRTAAAAAAAWTAGTASFAWRRIRPGPRTPAEVAAMAATSAAVPVAAVWHRLRGEVRARRVAPLAGPRPAAVLFDRDGTLVEDVPYNGDPALVTPRPGAAGALHRLRAAGVRLAVVTNQSGVARGLLTGRDVDAVHDRIEELLGPFDAFLVCPHGDGDGCECRKPRPGLVVKAAAELGVPVDRCVVVGDIGGDVEAALAAGARAVLVPAPATRRGEVLAARLRPGGRVVHARDLARAVDAVLGPRTVRARTPAPSDDREVDA